MQKTARTKTNKIVAYSLKKQSENWKLSGYKTCPLVSKETAIHYIGGLYKKSENKGKSKQQYQKLLQDVLHIVGERRKDGEMHQLKSEKK